MIDNLVILKKDDIFTTSEVIANGCDVKHHSVTRILRKYSKDFEEFGLLGFEIHAVKKSRGIKKEKIYLINEQQATLLMTYMQNTEVVRKFKKALVKQFFEMRKFILERHTDEWQETRKQAKLSRKTETDAIKQLVEYATQNGSGNANRYYSIYSKLADKVVGIKKRDEATTDQLATLSTVEKVMGGIITECISQGVEYHEIYHICKKKLEVFSSMMYLEKVS